MSKTHFNCEGYEVTLDGVAVTWDNSIKGTLTGGNIINWDDGLQWIKQEEGNRNIVYRNYLVKF